MADRLDGNGLWKNIRTAVAHGTALRAALFLDRDGTIIKEMPYLSDPSLVAVIPEAMVTIIAANRRGIPVVVVTNQSGIGRGYFDLKTYGLVEDAVTAAVIAAGGRLDAVYACPTAPQEPLPYGRKPDPGMLTTAADDLAIDLSASWIAGDSATDLEAGQRAGLCGGWLVPTGYGARDAEAARSLAGEGYEIVVGQALDGLASRLDT